MNTAVALAAVLAQETDSTLHYVSKLTGVLAGATGILIGAIGTAEALVCKDGICFRVLCIRLDADVISIATYFVPGVNATKVFSNYQYKHRRHFGLCFLIG